MEDENETSTVHLVVQNELFELSSSIFRQLIQISSSLNFIVTVKEKEREIYLDVDPDIFNAYLLYIQSGCFIRPDHLSEEDLIDGLRRCGAPFILVNHYTHCDLISALSSHLHSCYSIQKKNRTRYKWFNALILAGLFIATCVLSIDLYRQMLILRRNIYQETSELFIVVIYLIDGILFLYSCGHGISKFLSNTRVGNQSKQDPDMIVDIISCLGILCYFTSQRPITKVYATHWNSLWIVVHLCRTVRLAQIGSRLIDIQWCLYAISQCCWVFAQTMIGLFWIFIFSGSMLYTMDMIENNRQYSNVYLTILSAHETLYTIGYRNNAPSGCLTRLWTIISIYLISSLVQTLIWWFQTKVTIEWKRLLDRQKQSDTLRFSPDTD